MQGTRDPTLVDALIPLVALMAMLFLSVQLFGADSSFGPNQVVLTLGTAIAVIIAMKNGHRWPRLLDAMVDGISTAMGAMLILLSIGGLIGTWLMSGTVPTLIYYGLEVLDPQWFYIAACIISAIAALATGSSWTVAGTLGVGLIGVTQGLQLSPAIAAGAIVSGAYFGDKMSPLSDTTNLAPAVTETNLFTHIRHMAWTTFPAFGIALLLFGWLGFDADISSDGAALLSLQATLAATFNITPLALVPLVVVFFMAWRKMPPLPTILFGALLGGGVAIVLQPARVLEMAASPALPAALAMVKAVWLVLADGYVATTGNAEVDALLSRGGMRGMLVNIWLIVTAMAFGAVLEHSGTLMRLIRAALAAAKSTGALVTTVVLSCIGMNVVTADQYIAIVLPGKMFRAEFRRRGLRARNLSRVIEDSGTLTSPLVPWNTCGAFMAATLGVATLAYLPYTFFNLASPLISILYGVTGFTITRIDESSQPLTLKGQP